jgi:hypothetical protein
VILEREEPLGKFSNFEKTKVKSRNMNTARVYRTNYQKGELSGERNPSSAEGYPPVFS